MIKFIQDKVQFNASIHSAVCQQSLSGTCVG